jgi:hypothetical protein
MTVHFNFNRTQVLNYAWYVICLIVALSAALPVNWVDDLEFLPFDTNTKRTIKFVLVGLVGVAAWLKSHRNLFINPDGSDCRAGYIGPTAK